MLEELPGENNAFVTQDMMDRYIAICQLEALELTTQYPDIPIGVITIILMKGFMIGTKIMLQTFQEEYLKELYL